MNFKDALMSVDLILKSGGVPLLVGESGIGKTALAEEICKRNNYYLITIEGNLLKEGEIGGLPIVEDYTVTIAENLVRKKRTVYAVHHKLQEVDRVYEEDGNRIVLLFIDEINRCEHVVQQELMNIILNREINGYIVPPNTLIMSAMNPSNEFTSFGVNEYQVVEMDPAQKNRFVWVEIESDVGSWLEWGKSIEEKTGNETKIHNDILDFISIYPQYLHKPDSQEVVKATPRSWERISDTYKVVLEADSKYSDEIFYNVVKGNVGPYIAQEFINFLNNQDRKYLTAAEILECEELTDEIVRRIQGETYERLYLLAINCIGEISRSSIKHRMIKVFSRVLQLYPNDLRLAIMKKIKRDSDEEVYSQFLDNDEFIEAYFQIHVKGRS